MPEVLENLPPIVLKTDEQLNALAEVSDYDILQARILASRYPTLAALPDAVETTEGVEQ